MRLISQIDSKQAASTFHAFLEREGIESHIEPKQDTKGYQIWATREEDVARAKHWFALFEQNPSDMRFQNEEHPFDQPVIQQKEQKSAPLLQQNTRPSFSHVGLTRFIILICAALFIWNGIQLKHLADKKSAARFYGLTPLFMTLAFEVPPFLSLQADFFSRYPIDTPEDLNQLPPKAKSEYEAITSLPHWQGLYTILLKWPHLKGALISPSFTNIKEGQIWRLFTPCLLHERFFHILFNMLWLWVLGKQIEERLKKWQYLAITLILGVISNTCQYLMSGPFFLGYSGIICGFAGFIWMRQHLAPWEGHPLHRITLIFLAVFVFGMAALQLISFFAFRFDWIQIPMMIGNTAHITGGLTGALLGRVSFLSKGKI